MKTLSHLYIAVLATVVTLSSCKKSSAPSPATPAEVVTFMKLTSNGTAVNYNSCQQLSITANGLLQTNFIVKKVINNNFTNEEFIIDIIHDPATFKAGQTYQLASAYAQPDEASISYFPNDTDMYSTIIDDHNGSVTITEVTSTTISGTFSGVLHPFNDPSGLKPDYTITNGSFTAQINK